MGSTKSMLPSVPVWAMPTIESHQLRLAAVTAGRTHHAWRPAKGSPRRGLVAQDAANGAGNSLTPAVFCVSSEGIGVGAFRFRLRPDCRRALRGQRLNWQRFWRDAAMHGKTPALGTRWLGVAMTVVSKSATNRKCAVTFQGASNFGRSRCCPAGALPDRSEF